MKKELFDLDFEVKLAGADQSVIAPEGVTFEYTNCSVCKTSEYTYTDGYRTCC